VHENEKGSEKTAGLTRQRSDHEVQVKIERVMMPNQEGLFGLEVSPLWTEAFASGAEGGELADLPSPGYRKKEAQNGTDGRWRPTQRSAELVGFQKRAKKETKKGKDYEREMEGSRSGQSQC